MKNFNYFQSVMEVLSLSLLTTLRPNISEVCKDIFTQIVIPRCEKALDRIFLQVHETFTQGTTDCKYSEQPFY